MIQIHFRQDEHESRWAWTDGLHELGQLDFAVRITWPEHDPRDTLIIDFLRFLESYISSQPKRILPEQTLRYGWAMLRFVPDEHNLSGIGSQILLIEEEQHPFTQEERSYVPGLAQTMTLQHLQHEALRRNQVTGDAIYPSSSQIAIVCTRAKLETIQDMRPLMAHRAWQPNSRESGWFIGCCDHDHDHDDAQELTAVHLIHLVKQFPGLFPYLAMPVDIQLLFEKDQVIIFHPNKETGRVDSEALFSSLPR